MKKIKRNLAIVLAIIMVIGMQSTIVLATEENTTFEENITIDGIDGDEAAIDNKAAEAQNSAGSEEGTENVEPTAEIAAQSAVETYENGYVGDDVYGSNYVGDDVYGGNGDVILASGVCGDNLTWTFSDDGTLTISGTGPMWDYDITEERYPTWHSEQQWIKRLVVENGVTSIGNDAFYYYHSLNEVNLPNSLNRIGKDAFFNCNGIGEVSIPQSVVSIEEGAFSWCHGLKYVKVPEGVSVIGGGAFSYCWGLLEVELPNSITRIEENTFYDSNLERIEIPESVTSIGTVAFGECQRLSKIRIPSSVTKIEEGAFALCTSLTSIYFEGDAPQFDEAVFGTSMYDAVKANAYYPANNPTWTADKLQNYGGVITWIPWNLYIEEEVTDSVYVKGSSNGATIKCTEELGKFISVAVDGAVVDSSNYTVVEGSTVLTFLSSYLDTLSVGDHVVTLNYTYGSVDTTLTVLEYGTNLNVPDGANGINTSGNAGNTNNALNFTQNGSAQDGVPKTGDHTLTVFWTILVIIAGGSFALVWIRKRKIV